MHISSGPALSLSGPNTSSAGLDQRTATPNQEPAATTAAEYSCGQGSALSASYAGKNR